MKSKKLKKKFTVIEKKSGVIDKELQEVEKTIISLTDRMRTFVFLLNDTIKTMNELSEEINKTVDTGWSAEDDAAHDMADEVEEEKAQKYEEDND